PHAPPQTYPLSLHDALPIWETRPSTVTSPSVHNPGGLAVPDEDTFTTRPVYMGRHGVVASGHYLAARAGQRLFDKGGNAVDAARSEEHTSELQSPCNLVCRL